MYVLGWQICDIETLGAHCTIRMPLDIISLVIEIISMYQLNRYSQAVEETTIKLIG